MIKELLRSDYTKLALNYDNDIVGTIKDKTDGMQGEWKIKDPIELHIYLVKQLASYKRLGNFKLDRQLQIEKLIVKLDSIMVRQSALNTV